MRVKWFNALCGPAPPLMILRRRSRMNGVKSKKTYRTTVHDLRDIYLTEIDVPDVSGEFAGLEASPGATDADIVTLGIGAQISGQTAHE